MSAVLFVAAALAQAPDTALSDAAPLPLYLDAPQVTAALHGADWGRCVLAETPAVTGTLQLQISPTGEAVDVVWTGLTPALAACWEQVAKDVRFPAHADEPLSVTWHLALREGQVYPYPVVSIATRNLQPLFLMVAPDAPQAQRAALLDALGVHADAATEETE